MNMLCVHCGKSFSIRAEQLGTRGKCPHCGHTIRLPKSEGAYVIGAERRPPKSWLSNSISGFATIIVHGMVVAVLIMVPWPEPDHGDESEALSVDIAPRRREALSKTTPQWDWTVWDSPPTLDLDSTPEPNLSVNLSTDWSTDHLPQPLASAVGGIEGASELGESSAGDDDASVERDFGRLIEKLKRDGLDIVITFDSTGSMDAEIRQVKSKIERIGGALMRLVPKTRIGICTYRDEGDAYVVQGLRLTDNLARVCEYLDGIAAEGGGDTPEAVDQGLRWAIEQNDFRPTARKVILLFGDAPPHPSQKKTCLTLAANFRRQQQGTVSAVTCHSDTRLPDFVEIAAAGNGEAFLSRHEREIMNQLMILVFGSQHRDKVIEALELLGQ